MTRNLLTTIGLIVFTTLTSLGQTNYYVSPTGSNSNTGISPAHAWQTINFAAQNTTIQPGDTVQIMQGTYNEQVNITISGDGIGGIPYFITFKNYNNDNVILSGSTLPAYGHLMKMNDIHHLIISGLKFQDYQQQDAIGIKIKDCMHIQIENNEFYNIDYAPNAVGQIPTENDNSQPIIVLGTNPDNAYPTQGIEIIGNSVHDCETGYSEAISINGHVAGFEIAQNHVYNNSNIGIVAIGFEGECSNPANDQAINGHIHHNLVHDNPSAYAECGGIYIDGAAQMVVENNTLYNNNYGIEIGCENNGGISGANSNNNIIRNNVIYNNTYTGIAVGGYDYPTSGFVEYTIITNNTMYNNDTGNNYAGEMVISYTKNSIIQNNIFYATNSNKVLFYSDNQGTGMQMNYNLYYTTSGSDDIVIDWNGSEYNSFVSYQSGTSMDANSIFANPLFVDNAISNPDLHLTVSSPAIEAGSPDISHIYDSEDMDDEYRINSNLVDIGTDEYYATTSVVDIYASNTIKCFPNPTNGIINFETNGQIISEIILTDISGKQTAIEKIANNKLDLSNVPKGIYVARIKTNERTFISRIIKF
jgi:parallel beta-helix repeat protein